MTDHGNASVSGYIAVMCAVGSGVILITIGIMLVYYVRARNRERRPDDAFVAYLHQHARSFSVGVPLEDVEEANAARVERRRRRMECMGSHATRAYVEIISAEVVQSPHAADAPPMLSSSSSSSPPDEDDHDRGGGPPWEINEESLEAGLSNSEFVMLFGSEPTMWSVAMGRACHSSNQSGQRVHELDHPQHPHHQHLEGDVPHSSFSRRKKIMSHHIRLPSQEVYGHANYNTVEVRNDDG